MVYARCGQGEAAGDPWIMKPLPHAVLRPELWWRRGPECLKDTRLLQKLVCKGKKILLPPVTSTSPSTGCSNPCLPSARSIVDSTLVYNVTSITNCFRILFDGSGALLLVI